MCVMSVSVECLQQQQQLYLYPAVPYIDLHDTKKLDQYIARVQAAHNNHWGLKLKKIGQPHLGYL